MVRKALGGKSRRTPWTNLSPKERERLRSLAMKAVTGGGRKR